MQYPLKQDRVKSPVLLLGTDGGLPFSSEKLPVRFMAELRKLETRKQQTVSTSAGSYQVLGLNDTP